MNRNPAIAAAFTGLAILAVIFAIIYAPGADDHRDAINDTVDAFHQAAADAELDAYFDLMSDHSRFLGTDASERWPKPEFLAYCRERGAFDEAPAWVYTPSERHISLSDDNDVAWFDEILTHDRYGTLRGSGVLVNQHGWKIAQYNLTFLVPNDAAPAVVEAIKAHNEAADSASLSPSGEESTGEGGD